MTETEAAVAAPHAAPTFDELRQTVEGIAPLLEESGEAGEELGMLTPDVEAALLEGGFAGMWVPAELGGSAISLAEGFELIEELSYVEGSVGWVTMAHAVCTAAAGGYLADSAAETIFGEGVPRISGQGFPIGRAVPCEGGYMLSGRWSYGSGIRNGDWIHTGAVVFGETGPRMRPNGVPDAIILNAPREKFVFGDNWDVLGLKATGSIDYSVDDLFVPDELVQAFDATMPLRGGPIFKLGVPAWGALVQTAFAIGVGRRALDELRSLSVAGAGRFGAPGGVSDSFYERFAETASKVVFPRAAAYDLLRDLQAAFDRGDAPSVGQITRVFLLAHHVTWAAVDVATVAYEESGGVGLRRGKIQRCFRDLRAASQHVLVSRGPLRTAGQEAAGAAEGKVWSGPMLADPL